MQAAPNGSELIVGHCELTEAGEAWLREYPRFGGVRAPLNAHRTMVELYIMTHGVPFRMLDLLEWLPDVMDTYRQLYLEGPPKSGASGGNLWQSGFKSNIRQQIEHTLTQDGPKCTNPLLVAHKISGRTINNLHPNHVDSIRTRNTEYLRPRILNMEELGELIEEMQQNEDVTAQQIALLEGVESTDTTQTTTSRVEQRHLRRFVFQDNDIAQCWICHRMVPNAGAYIWCAHIKKRSEATEIERRDGHIVAGMCKFGCDALYEQGDIVVDETGVVQANNRDSNDLPSLRESMEELQGNQVQNFSELNAGYFQWHRDFHEFEP
jgi:hypothetical protein